MSRWNALVLFQGAHPSDEAVRSALSGHQEAGIFDGARVIRSGRILRFFGEPVRRFFWGRGRYSLDDSDIGFEHIAQDDFYEMLSESTHAALVEFHS